MKINVTTDSLEQLKTDALLIFLPKEEDSAAEKRLDKNLGGQIKQFRKTKDFTGESNQIVGFFNLELNTRVLIVGLGKIKNASTEALRVATSYAMRGLNPRTVKSLSIYLPKLNRETPNQIAQVLVEAVSLSTYRFSRYLSKQTHLQLKTLQMVAPKKDRSKTEKGAVLGEKLSAAVVLTRDLGNQPGNVATPKYLAEEAEKLNKEYNDIKVKAWGRAEIKKENMGSFLAVAAGSHEEPRFIILEKKAARKNAPTVVLVGKGITFDSGGISLKPSEQMEDMKFDMMGAATVLGIFQAVAGEKLPVNLIGLAAACENLPDGKSMKPGDIVKSRSGKSIEVINTDAEGRMILADALDYAKQYKPDLVIDFATLTGAMVVSLGDELAGTFSNNDKYASQLSQAAKQTGEKVWAMPLEKDYKQFIKSEFADVRNLSTFKYGGAITAALFLQNFVDYPWIHLDIAGVAWAMREKPYRPKGATGTGVRLTVDFLKNFKK